MHGSGIMMVWVVASCHCREEHTENVVVVVGNIRRATLGVVTERLMSSDDHLRLMSRRVLRPRDLETELPMVVGVVLKHLLFSPPFISNKTTKPVNISNEF